MKQPEKVDRRIAGAVTARSGSLQRMVRPIALKPGDKVKDDKGRIGIVVKEWGSFSGCPQCTKLVGKCDVTPCCGVKPTTVSGKGVFEVRMSDGKVHSINQDWLTCVNGPNVEAQVRP